MFQISTRRDLYMMHETFFVKKSLSLKGMIKNDEICGQIRKPPRIF